MNIDIFEAYAEAMESNCKLHSLMGEFDRIAELLDCLTEKAKAYREEGDIKGAEAIEQILLDDAGNEFYSVKVSLKKREKPGNRKLRN